MTNIPVDNDALKAKIRSCSVLTTFYHETQREIANLSQQLYSRDNVISDLKARLGKYERTYINVEGEEPVAIGPSKSLLESLCKEICKLKQKLKESETEGNQQLEASKLEIEGLQRQVREKEEELERAAQRTDQDQQREIQRLCAALAERDRVQATRAVLCNSLAEEADHLRGQLGATVKVCQDLLGRLEREKKRGTLAEEPQVTTQKEESAEAARLNDLVVKLQEENQQLKKRVAYVENLNAKWQKYDSSREEYVRGLCQRLKESTLLVAGSPATRPGLIGHGLGLASAGPGLFQQEISRLNNLLEEKMRDCERLAREKDDVLQRDQERTQMLEQQVLAYIEDFKSERADRERAQGKILDLQEEVGRLQLQIRSQNTREAPKTCRIHVGRKKSPHMDAVTEPLLGNSPDQPTSKRNVAHTTPSPSGTAEGNGAGDLQCPYCFRTYDGTHTTEYMKHLDECARL
ncbi:TNFAIP3-interacting protein 2 [Engraulis encrasicolus]|uniref:TNFAIP3-interacting protein 2 n=1 Tax=Engraulis encrasicolus TaxID=184585 RepID=UPI002FD4CC8F